MPMRSASRSRRDCFTHLCTRVSEAVRWMFFHGHSVSAEATTILDVSICALMLTRASPRAGTTRFHATVASVPVICMAACGAWTLIATGLHEASKLSVPSDETLTRPSALDDDGLPPLISCMLDISIRNIIEQSIWISSALELRNVTVMASPSGETTRSSSQQMQGSTVGPAILRTMQEERPRPFSVWFQATRTGSSPFTSRLMSEMIRVSPT